MQTEPLDTSVSTQRLLERAGLDFLVEFFERATNHRPDCAPALAELAHAYTRVGRLADGLAIDRRLVELEPENPIVHYNLACSLALTGDADRALCALEHAIRLGYEDADQLMGDDDLAALRQDHRFHELVTRLRDGSKR